MKQKFIDLLTILGVYLFVAIQEIKAELPPGASEEKINEALGGYQDAVGMIVQGLSIFGVLTAILALIFQLVRLSMHSNNPMIRQVILRNIGGTLIGVGILGGWNIIVHLVISSTLG